MKNNFQTLKEKMSNIITCSCGGTNFNVKDGIWTAELICKMCKKVYTVSK